MQVRHHLRNFSTYKISTIVDSKDTMTSKSWGVNTYKISTIVDK